VDIAKEKPMKALVVYESMFGNTRHVAEAIADGLRRSIPTETALAKDPAALDLGGVELVIAGAPTHAWGLSRKRTREGAATDAVKHPDHHLDSEAAETGVREWLAQLQRRVGCRAAAFDTRLDKPVLLTGSAARAIQRGLQRAGFESVARPESFLVTGMAGPLAPGEIERAEQWGEAIGRSIVQLTETHRALETSGQ
jgi:Flavodoxin domain